MTQELYIWQTQNFWSGYCFSASRLKHNTNIPSGPIPCDLKENICTVLQIINVVLLLVMLQKFAIFPSCLELHKAQCVCAGANTAIVIITFRFVYNRNTSTQMFFLTLCLSSDWTLYYRFSSPQHLQSAAMAHMCDAGGTQQQYDNTIC